jgi:hypothetical protein
MIGRMAWWESAAAPNREALPPTPGAKSGPAET